MKRITSSLLALLLALSMLIGMVPAALAVDAADTTESIDSTKTVDSSETEDVLDEAEEVAAQAADEENSEPQTLAEMVYAASEGDTITLPAGTYVIPSGVETGKAVPTGLTISGATDGKTTVVIQGITSGESSGTYFFDGQKTVTFKNLTIDFGPATDYDGFVRAGDMTFENVTIKGMGSHWGKGAVKFTKCSFVYPDEGYNEWTYNLWTYSGSSFEFKDCNFSAKLGGGNETNPARGKFVNVYSQATEGTVSVSLDTCKFKTEKEDGTTVTANKPILKIGNGSAWNISMTNIDITEAEAATDETTGSKLYGSSSGEGILRTDSTSVTINGTTDWKNGAKAEPTGVAKIGDTAYETLDAAFEAANDNDEIIINAGTYEMSDLSKLSNRTVTVSAAAGATVVFDNAGAIGMGSASVTFKGITFDYMPNRNYTGLQHAGNMVYNNCVFNGMVFLYGTSETFNTCKFNQTEEGAYNVWTYTGENVSFNNCEFTCYGRCVYIYNEGGLGEKVQTVSFVNSTFEAKKTVSGKAAIEISTELMGASATVAVDDKTAATGFATDTNSGSSLWNVKKTKEDTTAGGEKNATITVAGTQVFGPASNVASIDGNGYETLDAAITAAQTNDVITLIDNVTATATVTVPADKTITLDLNGKTYTSSANGISNAGTLTIKDSVGTGKLVATGNYSNAIENNGTLTIENGSYEAVYGAVRALGGSNTTIKGGTFSSSTGRYSMYYWANKVALTVTVEGGTFNNSVSTAMENGNVTLAVKGGSFATDLSDYCEEGFGTVLDSSTNLYVYGAVSHDGYVEDENGNVTISDEDGLFWFAKQVNNQGKTFSGKTVALANNIALTKTWTPIGVSVKKSFQGTFDGQGHTISNMDVVGANQTSYGYGFFKLLISATVKNVTFDNADVTGIYSNVVGIVSGYSYGSSTFENVHVTNSLVYAFGKVGGMVGMAEDGIATTTFKNCSVSDTTIHGGYNTAGFLGLVMGKCNITGSYLKNNNVIIDENSQGFGTITELDTTVACDGSAASCAGKGTVIKGKYLPNNGYYWSAYSDLYNHYGASAHDCILADGKKLANSEVTHDAPVELNGVKYSDLQAAIDAAKDGDTVTLLKSCNGNGIQIKTENFATKGLTVDFGGNTYSVGGVLVGSTGTGTNAFQLLQGGKVTFQNGTIAGVTAGTKPAEGTSNWHGAPALVIQNYCDLTLKSMTITGGDETVYTMSNNHGDIVIEDTTITAGGAKGYGYGPFAFDVCGYSSYTGVSVTVRGNSIINGDIEVSRSNANDVKLTLESGTINGKLKIDESIKPGDATTITKSDVVTLDAPSGYKWVDGTLTKVAYVAEINGKKYDSLQAAITAAADGDTVTLLADTTEDVTINKNITLDLGSKTLTNTNAGKATISVTGGTVTVKNGNVVGGTSYYNIEVTKGSNANLTLEGVTATAGNNGSSMIDNYGTLTITSGTYTGGLDTVKNEPNATLTINGGTFTLTKGTSKGFTGVVFNYGKLTITGGEFTQSDKSAPYGQAQVIHTDKSGSAVPSTTITGGTFKNLCTRSTAFVVRATNAAAGATKVSGGTFNKSISVDYCADGYIPTKNADGTYGVKEGKYVAQIGSKYYEKLADAIRLAAKGATIELLTDVNEAVTVSDKKNITLDLNGFTLTNTEGEHTIVNNGTLTIKDSSTAQTGTVDNVTHGRGALVNNGTVILSGGTFERSAEKGKFEPYGNGGNSWYTIANYGTMTIDNGTTVKNAGGYSSNIRNGGQDSTAKLTINGGTFDGGVNTVKNDANGVLEIKGGELKNTAQYVIMNWNKATISGGTFETAETAGAVLFSSAYQNQSAFCGELTITGGTFTAAGSKLIDDAYDADNHGTVKISGGSFNRAVDPKHCDTGFIPTQNADGTYGVKEGVYVAKVDNVKYETLQAAINAAKGGSTVRLLANVTLTETAVFPAGKTVHLNLVGHNITAAGTALRINGKTDIQSTDGVGTIESTGNVAVAVGDNANLTVYSGTLKGREGAVITGTSTGAKIEIRKNPTLIATDNAVIAGNGSKRDGKPNTILVKGGTFIGGIVTDGYIACGIYAPWNDNVTVSGGTFNITNGAGIVARAGTVKVTGGTFNCGDGTAKGWVGDSKNKVPNAALVFDEAANYPALTESSQILVSGGTFSTDPAANGAKLADGYVANKDESGMYKVGKAEPVAEINGVKYDTLQAAINAAQATQGGATITLLKNINTESYYTVNGDNPVTIDLAGCNITGSGISGLFYVTAKGDLTIKGEGTVTAVEDTGAAMAVWVRSPIAKVTLEGGTYTQQITNTADPHFDLIYVERGNVYVKGGTYKGFTPDWTLNCKDEHYLSKEANIEVTGGTFYGFDPGANPEGEGTTYVKTGYVSTKNADGTYGVKEGTYVAAIGEKKYATLAEAVDAAKNGDTITLIADVEQNTMLVIKKDITLDLAGKKIFNTTDIWSDANGSYELLSIEAKVTITGNGTIDAKENDCYTINVKNGDLTIENGTFYGNVSVVQVEAGMLTINGGKFDLHQKWEGKNTYLINCIDDAFVAKTAKVAIYGGDFVDFDPNVSPEKKIDGKAPSFAAPGVGITKNENNTFTAQADMAAQIVDADGNSVKAYATLKEAVNAAKSGETVIVLKEATVEEMITAEANITIDLNQKTVTVADGAGTMLKTTGDVTIKNGTLTSAVTANIINAYGKLKLESVKIYGSTVDGSNLVNVLGNAEVTIDAASEIEADGVGVAVFVGAKSADKDAKYTLNIYGKVIQKGKSYAISGNGSYPGTSYINIYEGAEVKASNIAENNDCCAIYQPQAGEINVYGGLVEGYCAIVMKSGTLNISGGTVRGIRNDNVLGDNNSAGNGASYDGSAIVVDSRKTGYAGNVKINVTGGTVESYYSTAIREIGNDSSMTQLVELTVTGGEILGASKNLTNAENDILVRDISVSNVAISGGTFNHEVQADYCAVGYEPSEKDASGMYTVQKVSGNAYYTDDDGNLHYGYLTTLLNNEATVGRVITLIDSVDYKGSLVVEGNRTINLAGYTFESEFYVFVTNGCGIKDSTDGSALIKVAPEKLVFMSNNEQLPIYDSANKGYRLFNCKVKGKCETNGDSATIWVLPEFENKAAYKLLKSGNAHNATISVTISWTGNDGPAAQEFTFKQSLIDIYAAGEGGATFTLRLTGLGTALSGEMSNIKAQSSIKSGAGVSFTGKEYSLSN